MTSYPALEFALGNIGEAVDRARQNLYYCDVGSPQRMTRSLRQDMHAATYVYVAAAMEAYINSTLTAVVDEINAAGISIRELRLSLFAMLQGSHLEALQAVRGLKMWVRRSAVFDDVDSSAPCQLDGAHLPIDGRTIRPSHLETLWCVLGVNGESVPSPRHSLALKDLADSRNAIAHGDEGGAELAGKKPIQDTLRILDRIDEIVLHIHFRLTDYLNDRHYLRSSQLAGN